MYEVKNSLWQGKRKKFDIIFLSNSILYIFRENLKLLPKTQDCRDRIQLFIYRADWCRGRTHLILKLNLFSECGKSFNSPLWRGDTLGTHQCRIWWEPSIKFKNLTKSWAAESGTGLQHWLESRILFFSHSSFALLGGFVLMLTSARRRLA